MSFWDDYLDSLEDTPMDDASNGLDDVSAMQEQWRADQQARATQAQQMGPAPVVDPSIGRVVAAGFERYSDQLHVYPGEATGSTSAAGAGGYGQQNLPGRERRITPGRNSDNAIVLDSDGDGDDADGLGDGEDEASEPNDPRIQLGLQPKRARETVTEFKARIKVAAERLGIQSKATLGDFAALGIDPTRYATNKSAEQARQRIRAQHEREHRDKLNPRSSQYDEMYAAEWRMDKANRQSNNASVKSNLLKEVREWQQKTGQPLEPTPDPDPDSGDEYYSNELVRGSRGGVLAALTVSSTRDNDRGAPSAHGRDVRGPRMTSRCQLCIKRKAKCSLLADGIRPCSRCREKGYMCLPGPPNYGYSPKRNPGRIQDPTTSISRNPFAPGPIRADEPSMLDPPPRDRRSKTPARRRPEGNNVRVRKSRKSRQRSASPSFELDPSLRNAGRNPMRPRATQGFMGPNIHGALDPVTGKQVYDQAAADFNYSLNSMNANTNTSQTIDPSLLINQPPVDPTTISTFAPAANPGYLWGNTNPVGAPGNRAPPGPPPDNTFNPLGATPMAPYQQPPAGMMTPFEQHNQREVNRRPQQEMQNASRTWNNDSIAPTVGVDPSGNDLALQQEMADMMDIDLDEVLNDPAFSPVVAPGLANPAPNNGPPQVARAEWVSRTRAVQMVLDPLWMLPDLPPGGQTGARHPNDKRNRCKETVIDPLTNRQKGCNKDPSKRCEFAIAHPDHADGHRDMMGQFKYPVCEECWYDNAAECKDLEFATINLTKSYVCGTCAIKLGDENKISRGKCPCIDKLTNSWVCKKHLKHGFEQIQANSAHKTAFLLNEYDGVEPCVKCYQASSDVLYGVYACKNCQAFMQEVGQ